MYQSSFVGHIYIMGALFQGRFFSHYNKRTSWKMGQLDSLVVHLLYFRGYEQHIQICRLLLIQVWTQGREAPS